MIHFAWLEALLSLIVLILELSCGKGRCRIVELVAVHGVKHLVVVDGDHWLRPWFGELDFACRNVRVYCCFGLGLGPF